MAVRSVGEGMRWPARGGVGRRLEDVIQQRIGSTTKTTQLTGRGNGVSITFVEALL